MIFGTVQDRSVSLRAALSPQLGHDGPGSAQGRLLAALASTRDIIVVSTMPDCAPSTGARLIAASLPSIQAAGFPTASITAPLSLSVLHDAIRETLSTTARPLVVAIENAENLPPRIVRRLKALAALRREQQPVFRLVLVGTPGLWTALRAAGLAALEHDPVAHIRLDAERVPAPRARPVRPPATAAWRKAARGTERTGRVAVLCQAIALAAVAFTAWRLPGPSVPIGRPAASADDRLALLLQRQTAELAAGKREDVIETRHRIEALIPSLSPRALRNLAAADAVLRAAIEPPAIAMPNDDPVHVTVRYAGNDAAAAARMVAQLRAAGMLADASPMQGHAGEHAGIAYRFAQDRAAADRLSQRLVPGAPVALAPLVGARPGEIIVSIGSEGNRT